jgi:hypothetical protein
MGRNKERNRNRRGERGKGERKLMGQGSNLTLFTTNKF